MKRDSSVEDYGRVVMSMIYMVDAKAVDRNAETVVRGTPQRAQAGSALHNPRTKLGRQGQA
jgi:hypothetical protein